LATGAQESGATTLEAIVLAAGSGSRFGGGKLLAAYGQGVLLDAALAAAFAAPVRTVILVTGASARSVAQAARLQAERLGAHDRLTIVHAADHTEGMGASLRAGVAALPADAAGVYVFLGDMPRVPREVAPLLAAGLEAGAPAVAPVFEGRRGNPVLMGRSLFPQLLELNGDTGARVVLERLGAGLALVEAPDDGVLFDVDRPGDLSA
jgi:molybdenum cofactor cytidylyltransferase